MTEQFTGNLRQRLIYEGLCEVGFSRIDDTAHPDIKR